MVLIACVGIYSWFTNCLRCFLMDLMFVDVFYLFRLLCFRNCLFGRFVICVLGLRTRFWIDVFSVCVVPFDFACVDFGFRDALLLLFYCFMVILFFVVCCWGVWLWSVLCV